MSRFLTLTTWNIFKGKPGPEGSLKVLPEEVAFISSEGKASSVRLRCGAGRYVKGSPEEIEFLVNKAIAANKREEHWSG